eukprot:1195627-Prorocentrum_minimum.AAC.6
MRIASDLLTSGPSAPLYKALVEKFGAPFAAGSGLKRTTLVSGGAFSASADNINNVLRDSVEFSGGGGSSCATCDKRVTPQGASGVRKVTKVSRRWFVSLRYGAQRREASFAVGVKGIAESDAAAVEAAVLATFDNIAKEGFEQERVEAVVHQIELSSRR